MLRFLFKAVNFFFKKTEKHTRQALHREELVERAIFLCKVHLQSEFT